MYPVAGHEEGKLFQQFEVGIVQQGVDLPAAVPEHPGSRTGMFDIKTGFLLALPVGNDDRPFLSGSF